MFYLFGLKLFISALMMTIFGEKWFSNSLNCIMLIETTHLTQVA